MPRITDAAEKLKEAALDLICVRGYAATSVDEICVRADVRKGSFYHFFPSKALLIMAALDESWTGCKLQLDGIFSPTVPPLERLEKFFEYSLQKQRDFQRRLGFVVGCPLYSIGSETAQQEPQISERISAILTQHRRYYESAIRDAMRKKLIPEGNAEERAQSLMAFVQGLVTQARIENSMHPLESVRDAVRDFLGVSAAR